MKSRKRVQTSSINRSRRHSKRFLEDARSFKARLAALDDNGLYLRSQSLRERHENGESLDSLMAEAFALVREATYRTLGFYQYDVQLLGAAALHNGQICEMGTGEGKTLVAPLAAFLNTLGGESVHVITVNEYLARRDAAQASRVLGMLGVSVGCLTNEMTPDERRAAYATDVLYTTNSEIGFDYLRDHIAMSPSQQVQGELHYAIIDEADSILIDEARTPLVISGASIGSPDEYYRIARAVDQLGDDDVEVDESKRVVHTTDSGLDRLEAILGLEVYASAERANMVRQALKARYLFHKDVEYIITNGELKIVDDFTGRVLGDRQYSEGLHQAIEAKEGIEIHPEHRTDASITIQKLFALYDKISGMTGTASTDSRELRETYGLEVAVIPPNVPSRRRDLDDLVFLTSEARDRALVSRVKELSDAGSPVLVGTSDVAESERISRLLTRLGVEHNTLNAKNDSLEASIIAQAGRPHAVTISTNMAGRGTDILLGGSYKELARETIDSLESSGTVFNEMAKQSIYNSRRVQCERDAEKVRMLGGLYVIGTGRSESRRVDNQLRGRAGRQGDPGTTQFYLSLDDRVVRLFAGDNLESIREHTRRQGYSEDEPVSSRVVTRAIERAQRRVEEENLLQRKNMLDYDEVLDLQRKAVYEERDKILNGCIDDTVQEMIGSVVSSIVKETLSSGRTYRTILERVEQLGVTVDPDSVRLETDKGTYDIASMGEAQLTACFALMVIELYSRKRSYCIPQLFDQFSMRAVLTILDTEWKSLMSQLDYLRSGVSLRSYAQRDPLVEYKRDAYEAFLEMRNVVYEQSLEYIFHTRVLVEDSNGNKIDSNDIQ